MTKYSTHLALFILVLLTRIPFLFEGFGAEEDSWGLALSAYNTRGTGTYEVSRFPGHPLQELLYILFFSASPFVFNFFSALFSAIATVIFYEIVKIHKLKYPFLAALTFAFTPIVFISSTYTIDYMWTIAFILLSFLALLKNNYWVSGLFLGFAIACRVTSGAMLIPFLIYTWQNNKTFYLNFFKLSIVCVLVSTLFYLPIYMQYGQQFFDYYDQFPYPSLPKVFYKASFGVWGFLGFILICLSFSVFLIRYLRKLLTIDRLGKASLVVLLLFCISYIRLPQKSGYLITIIPFTLILLNQFLRPRLFITLCISIISSSFILGINITDKLRGSEHSEFALKKSISGQEIYLDPITGPLYADYTKRKNKKKYTESVLAKCKQATQKQAIICGWWYNELVVRNGFSVQCNNGLLLGYANEFKMDSLTAQNYQLYYLPEQNIYNDLLFNIHFTDTIANPF
ncbi:MAG: glycosyltransferase family 39 protein [Bacteroidetes bacterium]|nr:glycosyltransferase family 39 protein [Bacteroidota bacterium]